MFDEWEPLRIKGLSDIWRQTLKILMDIKASITPFYRKSSAMQVYARGQEGISQPRNASPNARK